MVVRAFQVKHGAKRRSPSGDGNSMVELRRSNDLIFLSLAEAMLRSEGLNPVILDAAISAAEGGIAAFPRRLCVSQEEAHRARIVMAALDAEYG
jgi:hypothetical protein